MAAWILLISRPSEMVPPTSASVLLDALPTDPVPTTVAALVALTTPVSGGATM